MTQLLSRLAALALVSALAACGSTPQTTEAPPVDIPPAYEATVDGGFPIIAVDPKYLIPGNRRAEVAYTGPEEPGTIVVDTHSRKLYYVLEGGRAMRYGIAVGREGLSFTGSGVIGRKAEWPSWQPTANMIATRPDLYLPYANGRPGGLDNPLGARAMYLYRGGRDTMFRIHGTMDNASIGRATSAGCIRLFNQDAIHLYSMVENGAPVKVRTLEESLAIEGPYMDDAFGFAVPQTPENEEKKARDLELIAAAEARAAEEKAEAEERAAKEREKAERQRLRECRRNGIAEADCPPLAAIEETALGDANS